MSTAARTASQSRYRKRFIAQSVIFILAAIVFLTYIGWSQEATTSRFGNLGWVPWTIGCLSLFFGLLLTHATAGRFLDRQALRIHQVDPESVLVDGQQVALSGRIRVEGDPVEAPFSGTRCAAYSYRVTGQGSSGSGSSNHSRKQLCLIGYALCPAVLDCGSRRFRISALPDVDSDLRTNAMGGDWGRRALERIRASAKTTPAVGELHAMGELGLVRERVEAPLSVDSYVAPTRGTDNTLNVHEHILPADTDVTLLATYSSRQDALDGRRSGGMKAFPGTLETRLAAMDQEFSKDWKLSLVLLAVGLSLTSLVSWMP
jgi:hypothetical protein